MLSNLENCNNLLLTGPFDVLVLYTECYIVLYTEHFITYRNLKESFFKIIQTAFL